ncbi:T9SS type A sorting domain-containing protein [Winogradskyella psychrotolerans]|uniref:T9SS type A sorting domain-containing protein n=1 Tax=Winogradskyella psychrotolerans TaxID=1344585 RepID=UPI001C07C4C5|nr:T9SS type A sorting domain-containing protein [Winogradskyella psychrotolerans]MBU2926970.1 T9SS type A sorting domain-containing protein [Winogradskyella psychrotolerans]
MIKKLPLLVLLTLISLPAIAQTTYVPDDNFEQRLIDMGLDDVLDDYVLTANISSVTELAIGSEGIADLTGIEGFTALTELKCQLNNLTSLDLSSNTALTLLWCNTNDLTALILPNSNTLIDLNASYNDLPTLDVSNYTALEKIAFNENNLTSLDVSNNTALIQLLVTNNDLTELNVANGNNSNITYFNVINNNDLTCIQIDAGFDPEAAGGWTKNSYTDYSEDCSIVIPEPTTYVPDDNFEQYCIDSGWDDVLDDYVLTANINGIVNINIANKGIADLTGIEDFVALKILTCEYNDITTLDLSNNTALERLRSSNNNITTIDISNNTALIELNLGGNALTTIDVTNNTALTEFLISSNGLTTLDVSNNTALTEFRCGSNNVTTLNVSNNTALTIINCGNNNLTTLDVSNNTALESLYCGNNSLTNLDLSNNSVLNTLSCYDNTLSNLNVANGNNSNITYFDATNNPSLYCIQVDAAFTPPTNWAIDSTSAYGDNCNELTIIPDTNFEQALIDLGHDTGTPNGFVLTENINTLTSLNVTGKNILDLTGIEDFTALTELICSVNDLTSLDVSNITTLTSIRCDNNDLTTLNLSQNTALTNLECFFNDLTSLDLSNNTALTNLRARSNNLTNLDLSNNLALTTIGLFNNQITSLDLSLNSELTYIIATDNALTNLNVANGNNSNFTYFNITGNSGLSCVQIDTGFTPPTSWLEDATTTYNESCEALGLEEHKESLSFQLYPNPATDIINVTSTQPITKIEVFDVSGKSVLKATHSTEINISSLQPGLYLLNIASDQTQTVKKLIVK